MCVTIIRDALTILAAKSGLYFHGSMQVVFDSRSGYGIATVKDGAGDRVRDSFRVADGLVSFRGMQYRPMA